MVDKAIRKILWGLIKATLLFFIGYGFYRQPVFCGIMVFVFILYVLGMGKPNVGK
jgi:hypothetical protein